MGTVVLIAAFAIYKYDINRKNIREKHSEKFLQFLKQLYKKYPKNHSHVIVENLCIHKQIMAIE